MHLLSSSWPGPFHWLSISPALVATGGLSRVGTFEQAPNHKWIAFILDAKSACIPPESLHVSGFCMVFWLIFHGCPPPPPKKDKPSKCSSFCRDPSFLHNYCVLAMFPSHQSNHISTYDRWINEVELFSTLQDGQSSAITAQSTTSLVLQPGWQTEYSCDMPHWEQNKISKEFIKLISIAKWASSQPSCQWVTKCFLLPLQRVATLSIEVEQPSWPFLSQNRKNLAQQMKTNKVCNKNKCINQDSNKSVLTSINTEHFISRNAWLWSMHIDALNKHIYKHMVCFGMRKPAKKMNNATPGQGIHTKLKGSRAQMRTWETSNQQKKH